MTEQARTPTINYADIPLPTDRLTIGQMRNEDGNLFQHGLSDIRATELNALATCNFEHKLAHKAFAHTLGLPDPNPHSSRESIVELLSAAYVQYGLSHGPHETALLVEQIESSAKQQAARFRSDQISR